MTEGIWQRKSDEEMKAHNARTLVTTSVRIN